MKPLAERHISEIVAEDYRTTAVFQKYGIDFCCNGNRLFSKVCQEKGINSDDLLRQIEDVMRDPQKGTADYDSWPIDLLADYIEKKHHRYVENQIPVIQQYLKKLCEVHGKKHPELLKINQLFSDSTGELATHMKKEEFILFPYVRKMVKAQHNNELPGKSQFDTVQNPIKAMMQEHDNEGQRFREINQLSNNYTVPEDGCQTFRVAYEALREFENDLHLHIHLENNILFPKTIEMEKQY